MVRNYGAVEILTTGWCPLNCKYCYIPKTDKMKDLHVDIVKNLSADDLVDLIRRSVPGSKEVIGLWGTEPTLTMLLFSKHISRIVEAFPELKRISFSTSLILDPRIIADFAKKLDDYGIGLDVQISLDGPPYIADVNRAPGVVEKVSKNSVRLVELLNEYGISSDVRIHWKPTLTMENISLLVSDPSKIHDYFKFFRDLTDRLISKNRRNNIRIENTSSPTLTVPGKYTSEDGKLLAKFFHYLAEFGYPNTYVFRLLRLMTYYDEFFKFRMFTCSGGDSNAGFDGRYVHICHRTFYLNRDEYVQSILNMDSYRNWDVSHLESGNLDEIRKYYIVDPQDGLEMARFQHVLRGYHDFPTMKIATTYALIKEMAAAGQVADYYRWDDALAELLAVYLNTAMSCPMENILNTGSLHLVPISLVRLMGNGAFLTVVREAVRYGNV